MIYRDGFDFCFDENACEKCGGKCCTGESGAVFASADEISAIAAHLGMDFAEFRQVFLRKIGFKFSFKEVAFEGGFACVFFDKERRKCGIYALRPRQCREFPFWEHFKTHKKDLEDECIGVCF